MNVSKIGAFRPPVHRILVVEDDAAIRASVQEVLEMSINDAVVDVAENAHQALALLADEPYELVISDFCMPGMDGLAFLAEARRLRPDTPRILITAFPHLAVARQALEDAAVSNFLTKPLAPETLIAAVNAAVVKGRRPQWTAAGGAGRVPFGSVVPP